MKKILSTILLGVFLIGITASLYVIIFDKYKEETPKIPDEQEQINIDKLNLNIGHFQIPDKKPTNIEEEIKKRIFEYEYLLMDGNYYPSDIEKLEFDVFSLLIDLLTYENQDIENAAFSKEELQKAVNYYLGEYRNIELPNEIKDGFCDVPIFIYNPEIGYYIYNKDAHYGHGKGTFASYNIHSIYLINFEQSSNKYIVDYKIVIREEMSGIYYGSTRATKSLITLDNPYEEDYFEKLREYKFTEEDYQKTKNNIDTVRFTFVKENENYILDNVKIKEKATDD